MAIPHRTILAKPNASSMVKPGELVDVVELQKLTMNDRRIYNLLIDNAWDTITEDKVHEVSKQDLQRTKHKSYDRVGESIERLMGSLAKVKIIQDGEPAYLRVQLLGANTEQVSSSGVIRYEFPKDLRDIIRESEIFARLQREVMYQLTGKYSLVLYEMIQKRGNQRFINEEIFEIEHLRELLVEPGRLSSWINFRNKALDPAVKEVSALSDFEVSYSVGKTGKKITHVTLKWRRKDESKSISSQRELDGSRVGRKARINGGAENVVGISQGLQPHMLNVSEKQMTNVGLTFSIDKYTLHEEWKKFARRKGEAILSPDGAFWKFCEKYEKDHADS